MKKAKKFLALALSLVFLVCIIAGCAGDTPNNDTTVTQTPTAETPEVPEAETPTEAEADAPQEITNGTTDAIDTSEHVELKMYLIGDRATDFDEVYAEINKELEEKLNCSVNVEFLSWGEHDTTYSLLFSSQEEFDLIFTATSWGHYEQTASLGGFYAITEDFMKTYAPDIWSVTPEVAWNQARIDGQIYMVPANFYEFSGDVIAVRGDLMAKYGYDEIATYDDMVNFYMDVAAQEDGIYASQSAPWWNYFQSQGYTTTSGVPGNGTLFLYNTVDPSDLDITYILDWEGFTEYCKSAKEMVDAGAWSKDVLSNPQDRQTGLLNGTSASMVWNLGSCVTYAKQANAEYPEWNVTLADMNLSVPKATTPYINAGVGININSQHKERAMMALNEFYTNPVIQDLAQLGIEGKHWEAVGDDQYKTLDQTGFVADNNCNWGWRNFDIMRTQFVEGRTAVDDAYDSIMASWNGNIKEPHIYQGFNFNNNNVATQVAAVEAAMGTYYEPLWHGLVEDVDSSLEQFRAAMESAGIRDIIAEIEKQAAEYVATNQ